MNTAASLRLASVLKLATIGGAVFTAAFVATGNAGADHVPYKYMYMVCVYILSRTDCPVRRTICCDYS